MTRPRTSGPDTDARGAGFGVLGANSFIANAAVLPAIERARNARLVATASRSGTVPERWVSADVGSYEAVLEHPDVDAVYIPLPNGMHQEWTEKAAAAGKHVLCEKPLAADAPTARAMADTCAAAGVLLAEAWMTPFHRRFADVVDRAKQGHIGDIVSIDGSFSFTIGPEAGSNYRWDPDQGGGALLDVGIYCLGATVELFGSDPQSIVADQRHRRGVDASTGATLTWSDGRVATLFCSFVDEEVQRLTITGRTGSLTIETEAFTGGEAHTSYFVSSDPSAVDLGSIHHVDGNDSYEAMVEAFADAVAGRSEWPRPVERSIEMLQLIERIRDAAAS